MAHHAVMPDVQASCAICGAPAYPECPHEGRSLELALDQAYQRWTDRHKNQVRDWVLNHARNSVLNTFNQLRDMRLQQRQTHLQRLPYYSLYTQYNGAPPLPAHEIQHLQLQFAHADSTLRRAIDEDWRLSCLKYPQVLDYFFGLLEVEFPAQEDERVRRPVFGREAVERPQMAEQRRVRGVERDPREGRREHRKKHGKRRDSRGPSPPAGLPPRAPTPGAYY
ncbi:hypothetical protein MBLNU230_g7764t1 [Neophaeotheca triangularis]